MPAGTASATKALRRKVPHLPRRRAGHKHEEDDTETVATDESYTDDSGLSEGEGSSDDDTEDDFEDASDGEGQTEAGVEAKTTPPASNGRVKRRTDTEVMQNGISMRGENVEAVEFEDMGTEGTEKATSVNGKVVSLEVRDKASSEVTERTESERALQKIEGKKTETSYDRKRREHEEYRKRRAEDPSFVPNRGKFFMHDHRYDGTGSNGFRPFGPGGRGRGGRFGNDFQTPQQPPPPELAGEWPHDMHEQIETQVEIPADAAPAAAPSSTQTPSTQQNSGFSANNSFAAGRQRAPDQPRSFGRTLHKGTVQIQVNLPGMKAPITFSEVPLKIYTRLPFHRPPLRRDKPVRIALPDAPVRYIYPSVQRSFIFIPRAMRPGGSGYIRGAGGRGRGGYPTGGRNYFTGGSTVYTPSIGAMSRRSSLQYDSRHHTPAQAMHPPLPPQQPVAETRVVAGGEDETGRPIVRLPSATPSGPSAAQYQHLPGPGQAPTPRAVPQQPPPSYTPSSNPIPYRETRATPKIPMYQPRPQKAVNVAEIDSPAVVHFPNNYNGGVYTDHVPVSTPVGASGSYAQHSRHPSYPSQASGTPLSQIPEARSYAPQHPYYQPYPQPHGHIIPPPHGMVHAPMHPHHHPPPPYAAGPSPMPNGASAYYPVPQPMQPHQPVPQHQPPMPPPASAPPSAPVIAQESNGMVYYSTWDPNAVYYPYPPAPGVYTSTPGMPITPAPDGQSQSVSGAMYYYPPQGYYPAQ